MRSEFLRDENGNLRKSISCVYFLVYSGERIKIGCSANLMQRVYELGQSMRLVSFYPIQMIGYIEFNEDLIYKAEKRMHHKFARLKIKGDYFHHHPTITEFVENNCEVRCDVFNDLLQTRNGSGHRG